MNHKELTKHKLEIEDGVKAAEEELSSEKTSHLVHFIVSCLTGGVWIIGWIIAAHTTTKNQQKLRKRIKEGRTVIRDIEIQLMD